MKYVSFIIGATALLLATPAGAWTITPPTQQLPDPVRTSAIAFTRRGFLKSSGSIVAAGILLGTSNAPPAYAVDEDQNDNNSKNESDPNDKKAMAQVEKERQQAEKEARRLAEETKKRLAVGRIGTI